jgi:hypothetical protein
MKTLFTISLFLFLSSFSFSQDTVKAILKGPYRFNSPFPQRIDTLVAVGYFKNEKEHGKWVYYDIQTLEKLLSINYVKKGYTRTDYYISGQESFKGRYSKLRGPRGKWHWYNQNSKVSQSGKHLYGYKHGKWKYTLPNNDVLKEKYYYGYSKNQRKNNDKKRILVHLMTGFDARKAMEEEFIVSPITKEFGIAFLPLGFCSLAMDQYYSMITHNTWVDVKQFIRFGGKFKKKHILEEALGN